MKSTSAKAEENSRTSRGLSNFYEEKKQRINLTLTPTAIDGLDKYSNQLNLSISEFVERIGRGVISVSLDEQAERGLDRADKIAHKVIYLLQKSQEDSSGISSVSSEDIEDITKALEILSVTVTSMKLILCGEGGAGKSSLIHRLNNLENIQDQKKQETSQNNDRNELLTTQKAWELAKSRGYKKSKTAFRNWSKNAPDALHQSTGLIAILSGQEGKLVGYKDTQKYDV